MNRPLIGAQLHFAGDVGGGPAVRFEGVSKTFPTRGKGAAVQALSDIDLAVPTGSIVGVIGRSGAGKSTLIRLVNGLEKPSRGRVVVDGVDVAALAEPELRPVRRTIGMIFQHFNLLSSRTVFANVALPLEIAGVPKKAAGARVDALLDLVGLNEQRHRFPAQLSGGQKQRVGIARALATSPKVLLSDEATSALDPETTHAILELLSSINRTLGLTILLITHQMSVIRKVAHEVAVIDAGRIVEHGKVFDVFARPRHETTRSILGDETGRTLPERIRRMLTAEPSPGGSTILRVPFHGAAAAEPVLATLARELTLDFTILSGSIDEIGGRPFGTLIIGLAADPAAVSRAVDFLSARGLEAEVLGHVA